MQNSKFIVDFKYTRHGKVIQRLKVKIKTVFTLTVKKKKSHRLYRDGVEKSPL